MGTLALILSRLSFWHASCTLANMRRGMQYKFLSDRKIVSLIVLLLCALVSTPSMGESRTPHRSALIIDGLSEHLLKTQIPSLTSSAIKHADRENVPPVKIKAFIYGEGSVDISLAIKRRFSSERSFTRGGREIQDTTSTAFMQGKIALGGGLRRSPSPRVSQTALSVINNKLRITFLGRKKGSKGRQRLYTIHAILNGAPPTTARISSIPAHAARDGACSTPVEDVNGHRHSTHEFESNSQPEVSAQAVVATRVATLSTDADQEWYAKFGDESNAEILRIINTSEALIFRNFGMTFRVVKQHTYTDSAPYTSTRADYLLSQFVRNPENPFNLGLTPARFDEDVDLKHLFSGKRLEGNVLGIAYIGSLCATPHLAYGLTQAHIFDTTYGIFAHEISHSLGAFHDPAAPGTLMYPSITIPPAAIYSSRSLSEIRDFLLRSNACLSTELVDRPGSEIPGSITSPVLAPRALTLKKRSLKAGNVIRFSGTLTEGSATSVGNVTLNLIVKDSVMATTTTNKSGKYSFAISSRLISKRGTSVYVATEDWATISKALSISRARSSR